MSGAVGALVAYGTEAQKRRYLPWVLEGDKPAIAITEPEAGSAATDLVTRADEAPEGWALHGEKRWITGAGISRLHLVYCRMSETPGAEGIGGILVERDTPGFRVGERDRTMGLRGIPEGRLHFESVSGVQREQVLVAPPDGFKKLMSAYNSQRLGAATVALGLAQGAYELALAYAMERRQFGRAIGDFQGIRWKLADMAIKLDAARLLIHRAAVNAGSRLSRCARGGQGQDLRRRDGAGGHGPGAAGPRRRGLRPRAPDRAHGPRRADVRHRRRHRRDDAQPHRRSHPADARRLPALER